MRMMPAVFGMPSGFYARMRPSMQPGSMTYPQAVVLGVVQGVTEFLPVSSSGHLILVPRLFGWPDQGLAFDAAIHLGTLAALRSEEHTSELQSLAYLVCRLLLEKKKKKDAESCKCI